MSKNRIRKAVIASAVMAAIIGGLASPAEAAPASSTRACSTWQYEVVSWGTIHKSPGGAATRRSAKPGDVVNVHSSSDPWYGGDFYTPSRFRYYTGGWILKSHLAYRRCW